MGRTETGFHVKQRHRHRPRGGFTAGCTSLKTSRDSGCGTRPEASSTAPSGFIPSSCPHINSGRACPHQPSGKGGRAHHTCGQPLPLFNHSIFDIAFRPPPLYTRREEVVLSSAHGGASRGWAAVSHLAGVAGLTGIGSRRRTSLSTAGDSVSRRWFIGPDPSLDSLGPNGGKTPRSVPPRPSLESSTEGWL